MKLKIPISSSSLCGIKLMIRGSIAYELSDMGCSLSEEKKQG